VRDAVGNSDVIAAVIPALDEEGSVGRVVRDLKVSVAAVIVVDNGSVDDTARVARDAGAIVVSEPRRGYGHACLAGVRRAGELGATMILFLDGDGSDDPREAGKLIEPILAGRADLVVGVRTRNPANLANMTPVQRLGNRFAPWLMRVLLRAPYHDMPPYKAIRITALDALKLSDTGYGFTIELLIRAHARGLKIVEVDVSCLRRAEGQSKVSGTVGGSIKAASKIVYTIGRHALISKRQSRR